MRTTLGAVAAAVAVAPAVTCGWADEEKVPLDKLPKAVSEAVKKRFPSAELVEAAKETVGEQVEYEVTVKDCETKIDVMLTPNGKTAVIEKEIAAKDLPKAVADALDAQYPKATLKVLEEVVKVTDGKEALEIYEVLLVTAEKKTFEVKLTSAGKITETEEKTKEKKDKQ